MTRISFAVLPLAVVMAACSSPTPPDPAASLQPSPAPTTPGVTPAPAEAEQACLPANWRDLIGKPATDPSVPAASRDVRHIHPDTQVTMDFRPDRMNIEIDAKGVIQKVRCG